MKAKMTKAELEAALKKAEKRIEHLQEKNAKLSKIEMNTYKYLYEAHNPTAEYVSDLFQRTTLIRNNTLIYDDDIKEEGFVLEFNDKNRAIVRVMTKTKTKEQTVIIGFFKKVIK